MAELKQIACDGAGFFALISDKGNLRSQMAHYYGYFASIHQVDDAEKRHVVWVRSVPPICSCRRHRLPHPLTPLLAAG